MAINADDPYEKSLAMERDIPAQKHETGHRKMTYTRSIGSMDFLTDIFAFRNDADWVVYSRWLGAKHARDLKMRPGRQNPI